MPSHQQRRQRKDSELELSPSSGGFSFKDIVSFGKLKDFFAVDHKNRWPVQGWSTSSGDDTKSCEVDGAKVAAQESCREYTLDKASRWPLQGWCKGRQPAESSSPGSELSRKPSVQSRWPQGW